MSDYVLSFNIPTNLTNNRIMKLRSEIRTIDKQLSPLKKKNFQVTANAKIEVRRKLHKELLQYEWRFFEVNKCVYTFSVNIDY